MIKLYFILISILFWVNNSFAQIPSPPHESKVYILCYHTFLGKPKLSTDFSIEEFRQHMELLKKNGVTFLRMADIRKGTVQGTRNVLVMLDDGNRSAYEAYEKVLKPLKIPVIFAIYPGIISQANFAMRWEQLEQILKEGQEIASHGYFHEYMTDKFSREHPKRFQDEIVLSKKVLEDRLKISIDTFVYPFGLVSGSGKQLIRETGYTYAFGLGEKPMISSFEKLNIPRFLVTRGQIHPLLKRITQ